MSRPDRAFIQSLPKTETHLHIEGALPYRLLQQLNPARWADNPEFRQPDYRYPSFPVFEKILLDHAAPWFTSAERYHEAAKVLFTDITAQNVSYIETSFHLPMTQFIGVPGPEIIHAILSAAPKGVEVRVFAGMPRNAFQGPLRVVIENLGSWSDLSGVDLHGLETMPTEAWSAPIWEKLRKEGKTTKCHAGEFGGASRVREAIESLGALRIQHGVRAIEDSEVLKLAADKGATFDVCPISNVRLKVVQSIQTHPLRALMQAGIRCTVSTDDPLCFANTVTDEYAALAEEADFTHSELCRIARAGWEVALVDSTLRQNALSEISSIESAIISRRTMH